MAEKPHLPLASLQKWMQQSLLDPGSTSQNLQEQQNIDGDNPNFVNLVKDSKRLSAGEHLAIYQRSYVARLRDCMSKQFSALEYALGENLFRGFIDEYLQRHPSTNYNLITLGEKFPDFLETTRPDKNETIKEDWPDFMIELARFEYAINIIFEEKSEENILLATASTPEESLQLIPVFHAFHFKFPIRWYYHAFANKLEPQLPLPEASFCAVMRHNYKLSLHDLNRGQYLFLRHLIAGQTIEEAKELLLTQNAVDPEQLNTFWPLWKEKWILAGFFMVRLNSEQA